MVLALLHYLFSLLQFLGPVVVLSPFPHGGETMSMATMTSARPQSKQGLNIYFFANNVLLKRKSRYKVLKNLFRLSLQLFLEYFVRRI